MPFVQLLDTGSSIIKRFSGQLVKWFEGIAEQVTGRNDDESRKKVDESEEWKEEREVFQDVAGRVSLFPACNNVDNSLGMNSSIVPCSLSVEGLQSPMSMSRTPEGHIEWKLNLAGDSSFKMIREEEPISPKSNNDSGMKSSEDGLSSDTPASSVNEQSGKKFVCHYCDAEFKIRGYLTRHIKKHAVEKAYHCPFFDKDCAAEQRCHPTGGFSRRDTYKTHLRSRHFIYPATVKTTDRPKSGGHCGQCGKYFSNTTEWIEKHIEGGECETIPEGFTGTLKNSRRCGKLKMIKTSTGHSRFISTQDSVVEPKIFLNKDALEAMQIVADECSNSTPISSTKDIAKFRENITTDPTKECNPVSFSGVKTSMYTNSPPHPQQLTSHNVPRSQQATAIETSIPTATTTDSSLATAGIEAPLDEQCFSVGYSPLEDTVLDSINSISSQSSHENTIVDRDIKLLVHPQNISGTCFPPLDTEQGGYDLKDENKAIRETNISKITSTLERQMDDYALAERHYRETQQFLNFFNFTYNYEK